VDNNSVKDLTTTISLIMAGIGVTGIIAALLFFGLNIRRILQLLPAILVFAVFVIAVPLTVNRLKQPVTYESRANPEEIEILRAKAERVDAEKVKVTVSLNNPARVLLRYKGPGRDFIIPVTPEGGNTARQNQTFYIVKSDLSPGTVVFDVEGEEKLYLGQPLIIN